MYSLVAFFTLLCNHHHYLSLELFKPPILKLYPLNCITPWPSQVALVVKNLPANAEDIRDVSSIPELGRSPGEGHGNPLQYSHLENPIDKGAWWAIVHSVAESDTTEAT